MGLTGSWLKKVVLQNISEEFNGSAASHEEMYMHFANQFDVDLSKEFFENKYYIKSIRDFNDNHISYLVNNDDNHRIAALSAYEKLDNIDYPFLLEFASQMGAKGKALIFFKVHALVEHFDATKEILWCHTHVGRAKNAAAGNDQKAQRRCEIVATGGKDQYQTGSHFR